MGTTTRPGVARFGIADGGAPGHEEQAGGALSAIIPLPEPACTPDEQEGPCPPVHEGTRKQGYESNHGEHRHEEGF